MDVCLTETPLVKNGEQLWLCGLVEQKYEYYPDKAQAYCCLKLLLSVLLGHLCLSAGGLAC